MKKTNILHLFYKKHASLHNWCCFGKKKLIFKKGPKYIFPCSTLFCYDYTLWFWKILFFFLKFLYFSSIFFATLHMIFFFFFRLIFFSFLSKQQKIFFSLSGSVNPLVASSADTPCSVSVWKFFSMRPLILLFSNFFLKTQWWETNFELFPILNQSKLGWVELIRHKRCFDVRRDEKNTKKNLVVGYYLKKNGFFLWFSHIKHTKKCQKNNFSKKNVRLVVFFPYSFFALFLFDIFSLLNFNSSKWISLFDFSLLKFFWEVSATRLLLTFKERLIIIQSSWHDTPPGRLTLFIFVPLFYLKAHTHCY